MRVRAFAKINRSLEVIGTRADGYHELRTIFQSIALHDTLVVSPGRGAFGLTCDDPACVADQTNLVWRAADRLWRASGRRGRPHGVRIHLLKRIPMQAGLGGGSSDAAAALRALGRLWEVDESVQRRVGAALGADVPYFFEGGTVLGLERGDLLFPLVDAAPAWVVLAMPAFGVSTRDAFGWVDAEAGAVARRRSRRQEGAPWNDLQAPVARRHPLIGRLVRALEASGADGAAMTGSGSTVFGLFSRESAAVEAAGALFEPGRVSAVVTRTINRAAYRRLAGN